MADEAPAPVDEHQRAMQTALQASQEQAVRTCLGALDPTTRTDEGTYVQALERLQTLCQIHRDRAAAEQERT